MLSLLLFMSADAEPAEWGSESYLRPQAGLSSWAGDAGGTGTAVNLGANAGMYYWQNESRSPILQGQARINGLKVFGGGVSGTDLRVGNFIGPSWSILMLQTGPDLYWNEYQWGTTTLDPTLGLGWPLVASTGLNAVSVYAGVEPAWFLSSQRPSVSWDGQPMPGIGDEFTYSVGGALTAAAMRLSFNYRYTLTAFGAQTGLGFGLKIGG